MNLRINWDAIGISASLACAIHCALFPFLFSSLPVLGIDFATNPAVEYGLIGISIFIGSISLLHSFIKHHRKITPYLLFLTGMGLFLANEIYFGRSLYFLFPATGLVLYAYILNYRLLKVKDACPQEDCYHHHH